MNLISTLNKTQKELLKTKHFKKNEIIFNEEDECNKIGIVIRGQASISTYTLLEKTYDIKTLNENDIFGEFLLFTDKPFYLGYVATTKETDIAFLNKENLYKIIKENEDFFNMFMKQISNDVIKIQNKIKVLSQKTIREKVLFYIKNEIKRTSSKTIYINSKEELAKIINIPRPTLSRELILLKNDGYIDYDKNKIVYKKN